MIAIVVLAICLWLIMLFILKKAGRKVYFFVVNPWDYIAFIRIITKEKSVINKVRYLLILFLQIVLVVIYIFCLVKNRF